MTAEDVGADNLVNPSGRTKPVFYDDDSHGY